MSIKIAEKSKVVDLIKSVYMPKVFTITHMTPLQIKDLYYKRNYEDDEDEPSCLYYSTNFVRFLEPSNYNSRYMYGVVLKNGVKYTSVIQPSKEKILRLTTESDGKAFVKKYGTEPGDYNFKAVSEDFGGMEWSGNACRFFNYKTPGYGCIFNVALVDHLVELARLVGGKWVVTANQAVEFLPWSEYKKIKFKRSRRSALDQKHS